MRILSASVQNFGSYKALEFDFTGKGLTLISGPTGAGKSTFMDIVSWVLFGVTAKGGKADEVHSWNASEPTTGTLNLELNGKLVQIGRTRHGTKGNDLIIWEDGGAYRGKDIPDTQRLINQLLGMDADMYLAGAYYHEFSQTAQFFATTAKIRRSITEQLVDLSLATLLTETSAERRKAIKKLKETAERQKDLKQATIDQMNVAIRREQTQKADWDINQQHKVHTAKINYTTFDERKERALEDLKIEHASKTTVLYYDLEQIKASLLPDEHFEQKTLKLNASLAALGTANCEHCGAPSHTQQRMLIQKQVYNNQLEQNANNNTKNAIVQLNNRIKAATANLAFSLQKEADRPNTYAEQLEALKAEVNPYDSKPLITSVNATIKELSGLELQYAGYSTQLADLELLADVTDSFRATCLKNTITRLENTTNKLLNDHFDAEIRVAFSAENADKLEVTITKDGNEASYTQLSKGQRGLLKLCFGAAVMDSIATHQAISFNSVFFDESMDGMSEALKLKAISFFETLALKYENVFVIDHSSELKVRFNNRIDVTLVNGESVLEET